MATLLLPVGVATGLYFAAGVHIHLSRYNYVAPLAAVMYMYMYVFIAHMYTYMYINVYERQHDRVRYQYARSLLQDRISRAATNWTV